MVTVTYQIRERKRQTFLWNPNGARALSLSFSNREKQPLKLIQAIFYQISLELAEKVKSVIETVHFLKTN